MTRRILLAAVLGTVALFFWNGVANTVFRLGPRLEMRQVPDERAVYEIVRQRVTEPGGYTLNPALTAAGEFPQDEPVFGLHYSGFGHEAAGTLMLVQILLAFGGTLLAALLLMATSERVRSHFPGRLAFLVGVGLLVAMTGDLPRYGIGGLPASMALLAAASTVGSWLLAGAVMAWTLRDRRRAQRPAAGG
ncbi:MAG: hypothetical protein PVH00_05515 [Gemmatimonadota bacterium]|jgi:hypothetical protein